jgi:hypothetical protein
MLSPRGRAVAIVCTAAVLLWMKPMGLLLWARIRILTSIPRTAIADDAQLIRVPEAPATTLDAVALPRLPSRNPFAGSVESTPSRSDNAHSPHTSTPTRTFDSSNGAGEAKSGGDPADA